MHSQSCSLLAGAALLAPAPALAQDGLTVAEASSSIPPAMSPRSAPPVGR